MSATFDREEGCSAAQFGRLYSDHHKALVRFLTRMTRCPTRAEDLAQTTWLRLLTLHGRSGWPVSTPGEMRAYLFTAARHLFLDEYTRKHENTRTRTYSPDVLDVAAGATDRHDDPEHHAVQGELASTVRRAVAALPREQRAVIAMWVNGVPLRDMAAHASAPIDTVLSRKKYAFARMRAALLASGQHACAV